MLRGCRLRPRAIMVAALLSAAGARAEEPADPATPACSDKPEVCGREAFAAGVAAYKAGDFPTATARFTEALGFKWHPAIALNLALAQSRAGQLVEALRNLDAVLASDEASAPLREQATQERERVGGELAVVEIDTGSGAASSLKVDGASVDPRTPVTVDPGSHHLELTLPSGASIQRDVTLAPRERLHLSVDRTQELIVVPEPERHVAPAAPRDAPHGAPRARGVDPLWFYVGAGVTAVLAGVTIWSALDTESAHDDYTRALPTASQAEVDHRVADGHELETRTNVLIVATGIAAVGTATLGVFFVRWRPTATSAVVAGPSNVTFRGTF